jgi:hypothetical protein
MLYFLGKLTVILSEKPSQGINARRKWPKVRDFMSVLCNTARPENNSHHERENVHQAETKRGAEAPR